MIQMKHKIKKTYKRPQLKVLGSMPEVTLGGSGRAGDICGGGNQGAGSCSM